MNFLEISKRVRQECGISGDGPPSVAGQNGIYARIIDWVKTAHEVVQDVSPEWNFDWDMQERPLVAGQEFYGLEGDWGLQYKRAERDGLYLYRTADGPQTKMWIPIVDWATLRHIRRPGITGLPVYAAVTPDERMAFYPIPDGNITAVLEYFRTPQVLVANTDVPRIPPRFHMAIVWRAVMFWCAYDENPALFQSASQNYRSLINKMSVSELPHMAETEPLA